MDVREFATASGLVDYALFVDKRFCGVVEAKPAGTTLSRFPDATDAPIGLFMGSRTLHEAWPAIAQWIAAAGKG